MYKRLLLTAGLILLVILTSGLSACAALTGSTASSGNTGAATATVAATATALAASNQIALPSIAAVVAVVQPSVVAINVQVTTFDFFNQPVQTRGAGSGWVIRSDGYIVTNNHVVEGADDIVVTMMDGNKYPADEVFADAFTDLAVIKINAGNLPALAAGNSAVINVGDWVIAIGNALGQGISATTGIVSAKDVSLSETAGQPLDNLIQTDTAINPGNSGGPLVNLSGEVIGITSLKITQVGVEGMGYAIGINQALPVINALISNGKIVRPWLGISAFTLDSMVAAYYDLPLDTGVLITDVTSGSPADEAGLQPGDIITGIDGNAQTDAGNLMTYINSFSVGQQITITYQRENNQNTVTVTLAEAPS